ncbi:MAG TPA: hypothetical protein VJR92_12405 [Gemmatimonadaceae bacterium]|nr:hypothetical protein [Gemmatimonadaceae bacterium]
MLTWIRRNPGKYWLLTFAAMVLALAVDTLIAPGKFWLIPYPTSNPVFWATMLWAFTRYAPLFVLGLLGIPLFASVLFVIARRRRAPA